MVFQICFNFAILVSSSFKYSSIYVGFFSSSFLSFSLLECLSVLRCLDNLSLIPEAEDLTAFSGRSSVPFARHSQPTGIPWPHQWLLMGIQRRQYTYPKARSIASSGRSSVPFARHSQPTGIPRPHQWLQTPKNHPTPLKPFLWASSAGSQQASQGHINGFLWASKLAVCQPLNP